MNEQETIQLRELWKKREAAEKDALAEWLAALIIWSIPTVVCILLLIFLTGFRHVFAKGLELGFVVCGLVQVGKLVHKLGSRFPPTPRVIREWCEKAGERLGILLCILIALFFAASFYFDFWGTLKAFLQ